jgi:protein-L-isoaspartate O-methyltransferase
MTTNIKFESSPAFFEEKYRERSDPWNFSASEYELRRYQTIIAALSPKRYSRAFEPGCSVGVLTALLATVCDFVEAIDFSQSAVQEAQRRCEHLANVHVHCASLPERMPVAGFDLIVLSEIGYYFAPDDWKRLSFPLIESMPKGGTLLAAHWLGHSRDHSMNGDQVHEILQSLPNIQREHSERHERFRIDRWVRT